MRLWEPVPKNVTLCQGCSNPTGHLHRRLIGRVDKWLCDACYLLRDKPNLGSPELPMESPEPTSPPVAQQPPMPAVGPATTLVERVTDYVQKSDVEATAAAQLKAADLAFVQAQEARMRATQVSDLAIDALAAAWQALAKSDGLQPGVYLLENDRALAIQALASTEPPRPAPVRKLA